MPAIHDVHPTWVSSKTLKTPAQNTVSPVAGETVSCFKSNSSINQPFRGESLLENQKINYAGFILDEKIEISELQPRINLLFNRFCKVKCRWTSKGKMLKPRNTENRKCGNPDHPEIGKSEINQKPKAIPTIRDSCIRLGLLFDVETRKR